MERLTAEERIARRRWLQANLTALISEIAYHKMHREYFHSDLGFQPLWPPGELNVAP